MALPVTIPNTFANATSSIQLSQLDTNFSTLANAVNGLNSGSETLANLKATTANVGVLTVTGNATIGDASTDTVTLNSTLTANTAVIFAAGTSAAPSITTTGDLNTGIFFPAADTIAFTEGGVEAMRIDSSGNVGIGTTTTSGGKLTVNGGSGTSPTIRLNGGASADDNALLTSKYNLILGCNADANIAGRAITFVNGSTEYMRIDSSGNVGIGTSSPQRTLGVHVASASSSFVQITNTTSGVASGDDGLRIGIDSNANGYVWQGENLPLIFGTNNTERARITSDGYFWTGGYTGAYESGFGASYLLAQSTSTTLKAFGAIGVNASYADNVIAAGCLRSASSSYWLFSALSGDGSTSVSNDYEFRLRGDGNGYADGTWNNNGADYAEFFESTSGQALTLGATVVLDGNKVREATSQDPASAIIGVVRPKEPSKASMVIGNTAWNKWANKYLTDDFDRYIMEDHDVVEWEEQVLEREAVAAVEAVVDEDGNEVSPAVPAQEAVYKTKQHSYESHNIPAGVTVPADAVRKTHDDKGNKFQHYKLNPAWDKDAEYVNRENRPEWNIIGLLGQVKILKGQPVGERWIKMRDVSAAVEEWMIR